MAHWESDSFRLFCWAREKDNKNEERIKKQITKARFFFILLIFSSLSPPFPKRIIYYLKYLISKF
jgi:hypothetical protein